MSTAATSTATVTGEEVAMEVQEVHKKEEVQKKEKEKEKEEEEEEEEEGEGKQKVLLIQKNIEYVTHLFKPRPERIEYWMTEHLRVSGIYWGLTALATLGALSKLDAGMKEDFVSAVIVCQNEDGGFGGNDTHDSHLLYTLSAVQVLHMLDALDKVDSEGVVTFVASLQKEDGSFSGDKWGEIDTRFSYCALSCLSLLKSLPKVNVPRAVKFILSCQNFDGAFGVIPGAESHAGQTFCCVGALDITNSLHLIDGDLLGWWLCERQVVEGGLNGRPEKLADVCYSWWVLSSLSSLKRLKWIDQQKLIEWIILCQDDEDGGISDKPLNVHDVYHTCFGVTGLSLLGYPDLEPVDPRYCMPKAIVAGLELPLPPKLSQEQVDAA